MGKFWSFLFLLVPILGVAWFAWAMLDLPPLEGHWLPRNINAHTPIIDNLFYFILVLTGVIFVITGFILFWFMLKYDAESNSKTVEFTHGSHTLEVVWTILPAVTLLFIAIYQINAWAQEKIRRPDIPVFAEVTGRQFEWRIRYPGKDGIIGTPDDIHQVNDLHFPVNEEILLMIKSQDVLHSFNLPHMRIKHDVVPGMEQYTWFRAIDTGSYDIVCTELCGWGHYKMKGRYVVESREQFNKWLAKQYEEQELAEFKPQLKAEEE